MKHTYTIETLFGDKWLAIVKLETLGYYKGWMDKASDSAPRPAYRVMRSDGKMVDTLCERTDVSIGQVAGYPTAEQYEAAAQRALEKAAVIRKIHQVWPKQDEERRAES